MFLGFSKFHTFSCKKLSSGSGLFQALQDANATTLKESYQCGCGETHTYLDGLIENYNTDHQILCYDFISNFRQYGQVEITIGNATKVSLSSKLRKWHKVILSPQSAESRGVSLVQSIEHENCDYFYIISSSLSDSKFPPALLGEKAKVSWFVYGNTEMDELVTWEQLILVSREQLINGQYSLSYLTAAMTLESYLNLNIKNKLMEKGISENASEVILKETLIMDKLFIFSKDILDVDFSIEDYFKLSKNKLKTLFEIRNKIAHGKRFEITKDEAYTAFEIVIRAILKVEEIFNPHLFDFPQCFMTDEVIEATKNAQS